MNKKAFTLAEVLITIGIIGIVAAMTLPSVINKIQKRHLEVAFKKTYSVLTQVAQKINYDNGGSFIGATDNTTPLKLFLQYFKTAQICNQLNSKDCGNSIDNTHDALVLPDGISMTFAINSPSCTAKNELKYSIGCFRIRVDTNGYKRPNKVGQDIFDFYITQYGLIPRGAPETTETAASTGYGAAYYVLQHGIE